MADVADQIFKDSSESNADHALSPVFSRKAEYSGLIFSVLLHIVMLVLLSLLVIASQATREVLITDVAFQDSADFESIAFDVDDDLQLAEVEPVKPSVLNLANLLDQTRQVNLSPVGFEPASMLSGSADVGEAASAAAGIRKRVKAAGGATGEIQFSLSWLDRNDLDLHVIAPSGERIFYRHKQSRCRGRLDVDMNSTPTTNEPVENTRWMKSKAPEGRYTVLIHFYQRHTQRSKVPFKLLVKLKDDSQLVEGTAMGYNSISVHRFYYVAPKSTASRRIALANRYKKLHESEEKTAQSKLATAKRRNNQSQFLSIAQEHPHTDAGLEALRLLTGGTGKQLRNP